MGNSLTEIQHVQEIVKENQFQKKVEEKELAIVIQLHGASQTGKSTFFHHFLTRKPLELLSKELDAPMVDFKKKIYENIQKGYQLNWS